MKSSYKQLLSDTVVFGVGNALMKLVQFCLMPIYTAYMTTEKYGVGELINNLNELLYPLACLAIYDAVFRFALDDDGQKKSVLSSGLALTVISLPIVLVAASISFFVFHFQYAWLLALMCFTAGVRYVCVHFTRGINRPLLFAGAGVFGSLVIFACAVLFLSVLHLGITGYLLSFALAHILTTIFVVIRGKLYKYFSFSEISKNEIQLMVRYSIPMIPNGMTWSAVNFIDRYAILIVCGASTAGLFTAAGKLPAVINMISMIAQQSLQIFAAKEIKSENKNKSFSTVFSAYSILMLLMGSFVIAITELLSKVLLKGDFYEASKYVPLLLVVALISNYSAYFAMFYNAIKDTKMILITTVIGALVNIVFAIALVIPFGAWGVITSSVIAYLTMMIMRYINTRHIVHTNPDIQYHIVAVAIIVIQVIILSMQIDYATVLSIILLIVLLIYTGVRYRLTIAKLYKKLFR